MRKTHNAVFNPEELPGVKKQSFALPFNDGEIWFEHLDGMYQHTELVFEKLKNDSHTFLLPSKPTHTLSMKYRHFSRLLIPKSF